MAGGGGEKWRRSEVAETSRCSNFARREWNGILVQASKQANEEENEENEEKRTGERDSPLGAI